MEDCAQKQAVTNEHEAIAKETEKLMEYIVIGYAEDRKFDYENFVKY